MLKSILKKNIKKMDGIYEGTFTDKNDAAYKIQISFEYPKQYVPGDESTDIVKRIKVKVIYPAGNTTKSIDISTLIFKKE